MAVVAIDVGGHAIKAGIVSEKGFVREKEVILTDAERGREVVVDNILKMIKGLLAKDKTIKAVGIGIPGIVDKKGYVKYTPNIPLSEFDLGKELRKKLKLPKIVFGNDADNFALAIHHFGQAKGFTVVVALTLGTGVGSGLIINGKLFSNNGAPELGHTTIKFDGPQSTCCGNDGCIESFIGRRSFPESPLEIYKRALKSEKYAIQKFHDYGMYLGIAISNFINILNPEIVVLGGELRNAFSLFRHSMEVEIKKRALFKTRIVKCEMRDAGTIGAAVLAMEN